MILIGRELFYKPVTLGKSLAGTSEQNFTHQAKSLKPFAPVHMIGSRDVSGNLTISWIRRSRLSNGWRDGVDIPLGEETERYAVDILDNGNIIRTIEDTTSEALYTASSQITDFGSTQSQITVQVSQISALVGKGYSAIKMF